MYVIINPGTGPVASANCAQAWKNIRLFRRDLIDRGLIRGIFIARVPEHDDGEGRYAFNLSMDGHQCDVLMPGIAKVRFLRDGGDSAWDYPRLYVDGNSWLWCFALNQAACALGEVDDEA